jgi:hypothetical protein
MIFATGMGTIRQTVKAGRGNQECEMGKMKRGKVVLVIGQ